MTDEITYDEIELMKEGVCDGCKGLFTLHETGCYERCKPFQEELKEARDQMHKPFLGSAGRLLISIIKGMIPKRNKQMPKAIPHRDPYAPRGKNVIYPNDGFAREHIDEWLDDVFDKHHG